MQQYTWIYTLTEPIDKSKRQQLEKAFEAFLSKWQSHGRSIAGRIWIPYNRFIFIQANSGENRPSGCSIDSLKYSVGDILKHFELPWLDASYISYKDQEGNIHSVHFNEMEGLVKEGEVHAQTLVFDHSLSNSDDIDRWEAPLVNTWMRRYLPSTLA